MAVEYVSNLGGNAAIEKKEGTDDYRMVLVMRDTNQGVRTIVTTLKADDVKRLYLSIDDLIRQRKL